MENEKKKYKVSLSAMAVVRGCVTVEASGIKKWKELEQLAVEEAKSGKIEWKYDGVDDSTIEVEGVFLKA